jgi:hypothetical protein
MTGVDGDLLGAFAWACLAAGKVDRARDLLDDTYGCCPIPNTHRSPRVGQTATISTRSSRPTRSVALRVYKRAP